MRFQQCQKLQIFLFLVHIDLSILNETNINIGDSMYVLLCGNINIFQFPQLSFHKCIICGRFFSNVKFAKLKLATI